MKKLVALLLLPFLLFSCKKDDTQVALTVQVTNVDQPSDKSAISEVSEIHTVTLLFFRQDNHNLVCEEHQSRADFTGDDAANFGVFNVELSVGAYDMVVLGYRHDSPVTVNAYNSVTFPYTHMVYSTKQSVSVTASGTSTISATLSRITSQFRIITTDQIPAGVESVRISFSKGGTTLNPMTDLATTDAGCATTISGFSARVGENPSVNSNLLLYADEQTMDVLVEVLDASNNVVISHNFENLPFKRNRRTYVTGPLYHQGSASNFDVNTSWIDEYNGGTF